MLYGKHDSLTSVTAPGPTLTVTLDDRGRYEVPEDDRAVFLAALRTPGFRVDIERSKSEPAPRKAKKKAARKKAPKKKGATK
jgi:hypothetical protein